MTSRLTTVTAQVPIRACGKLTAHPDHLYNELTCRTVQVPNDVTAYCSGVGPPVSGRLVALTDLEDLMALESLTEVAA